MIAKDHDYTEGDDSDDDNTFFSIKEGAVNSAAGNMELQAI